MASTEPRSLLKATTDFVSEYRKPVMLYAACAAVAFVARMRAPLKPVAVLVLGNALRGRPASIAALVAEATVCAGAWPIALPLMLVLLFGRCIFDFAVGHLRRLGP